MTFYFYWTMASTMLVQNLDLALCATIGLVLNFISMRAFHTYQALLMTLFFLWRTCFSSSVSSSSAVLTAGQELFQAQNWNRFATFLLGGPFETLGRKELRSLIFTVLVTSVLLLEFIPKIPKLAKAHNPFYPLGDRLKASRPHPEDDDQTAATTTTTATTAKSGSNGPASSGTAGIKTE